MRAREIIAAGDRIASDGKLSVSELMLLLHSSSPEIRGFAVWMTGERGAKTKLFDADKDGKISAAELDAAVGAYEAHVAELLARPDAVLEAARARRARRAALPPKRWSLPDGDAAGAEAAPLEWEPAPLAPVDPNRDRIVGGGADDAALGAAASQSVASEASGGELAYEVLLQLDRYLKVYI